MKLTLFRKQLAILLLVTIVFAGFAMFVSDLAVRAMMNWSLKEDASGGPTQGLVRLVDELTADGKLTLNEAVEKLSRASIGNRMHGVRLVERKDLKNEVGVEPALVPDDPFQAHVVREKDLRFPRVIVFRSKSDPDRYLVFERNDQDGPPPGAAFPLPPPGPIHVRSTHVFPGPPRPPPIFLWTFGALILSGFLAAAISLFLLFSSMRQKARQAADVINAIKKGDWQKRMPIDGVDEVGHLMQEFNRMADEIESAVRSMQRTEASRTNLLQELAHDLRTPIASLRGLIETLEMRSESLSSEKRRELFTLAQKEVDYFARLVEDLLFLAQVRDPRYVNSGKSVDLAQVIRDQIDRAGHDQSRAGGAIQVSLTGLPSGPVYIRGDEFLLKRMVRNAIDNAISFAQSKVLLEVSTPKSDGISPSLIRLSFRDDGPGFSNEALQTFGEKRFSRFLGSNEGERLSVGLGSVIMSTVASVHGGKVEANNIEIQGRCAGAEVSITLPTSIT